MSDSSTMNVLKASQQSYIDGDFDKAIETTLKNKDQLDPGLFHYNLGSLYLKKGELGPARLHIEKAKTHNFSYPMLWNNLKFINSQSTVLDPTKSKVLSEKILGHYLDIPSYFFTLFFFTSMIAILCAARFKKISRKPVLVALFLLSIAPGLLKLIAQNKYQFAVVISPMRVHEGPSKIFQDFGEIPEGSRVIVGKYHEKWYYILSPSSVSGWIEKSALGFY